MREAGSRHGPLVIRGGILRGPAPLLCLSWLSVLRTTLGAPPRCYTQLPTKVARNLIWSLFEIARKRCNSNDAISHI